MKYLLDTCIIAAILNQEQGHRQLEDRIVAAPRGSLHVSAITAVEVWIGLARPRDAGVPTLTRMFNKRLRGYRAMGYTVTEDAGDTISNLPLQYL